MFLSYRNKFFTCVKRPKILLIFLSIDIAMTISCFLSFRVLYVTCAFAKTNSILWVDFLTPEYIYIEQTTPAALLLFLLFKCVLEFLQRLKLNLANFEENLQRQVVQVGHSKNLISTTSHSFTIYFVFQLLPLGQWIFTVFRNKTSNIIKFVLN